jgi:membrane associated rhomboid family serine protease
VQFLLTFAFIPARYDTDVLVRGSLPGGFGADLWTFFTYAFLHADLLHIAVNLAWLLPFGTAVARRFGAWRYAGFMLVTAAAGAFAHLISYPHGMVPMIGASAAISGTMAAAMRFVFQQGGPLAVWRRQTDGKSYRVPASSLLATLRDPRFLTFLAVWIGLNALFGLGTLPIAGEGPSSGRRGGFLAGPVPFNAFDPPAPQKSRPNAADPPPDPPWAPRRCRIRRYAVGRVAPVLRATPSEARCGAAGQDRKRSNSARRWNSAPTQNVTFTRLSTRSVRAGRHSG